MNIDLLIKMANQITSFWEGEAGHDLAVKEVSTHLRRYWEPRMRAQINYLLPRAPGSRTQRRRQGRGGGAGRPGG